MGQRQSSPEETENSNNENTGRNERVMRTLNARPPPFNPLRGEDHRARVRRAYEQLPTIAHIPVNESQRREERRLRRAFIREQVLNEPQVIVDTEDMDRDAQVIADTIGSLAGLTDSTATVLGENQNEDTIATITTTQGATVSSFSRMIAQVISEAVVASFRSYTTQRQRLTMHLSPELFRQIEPQTSEDLFIRFMRLPVLVNSADEGPAQDGAEVTRIMVLPVFLYGQRTTLGGHADNNSSGTRSSARLRERREREEQQRQQRQWTVYIISGNSVENMMNDNPTYEELLNLASMIGPARRPTVSQEAIDNHLPFIHYTQQVKQTILGNSEKCQVCLNNYQSEDNIRILLCHHGFHKDCIDEWLTQGQNKCPLCRKEAVPNDNTATN